jgi:L-ascorbate metabolism protein UlaG (beta-lactamase superfamily)
MSTMKRIGSWLSPILLVLGLTAAPAFAMDPTLTWLGHAAFKYTASTGKVILIDPWITNPKAPKNIQFKHVDGILITHAHADHVGEAFELAKKYNAPIIASYELTQIAVKHGVKDVLPLNPSGSVNVAGVKVTAVEAVHSSGYLEGETMIYGGAPLGFILEEYGSATLYHAGDTGVFENMVLIYQIYQPSIAMLPIGGVYTMKPLEAAHAAKLLKARTVIPMHFGTFPALTGNTADLKKEMARVGALNKVVEMTPGTDVKISELLK